VTGIYVDEESLDASRVTLGQVALNLTYLPTLVKHLPELSVFKCFRCNGSDHTIGNESNLPNLAGSNLHYLSLRECGITGHLPDHWGGWSSAEYLELSQNSISGTLPNSFAALPKLQLLDLSYNYVKGSLPDSWGSRQTMRPEMIMNVAGNAELQGTIPASWARFSKLLMPVGTNVSGCTPGLWAYQNPAMPPCWLTSPELVSLITLKKLLTGASAGNVASLTAWNTSSSESAWRWQIHIV
jgi:hypothetical protein